MEEKDLDQPATKGDIAAVNNNIAAVETGLKTEIAALKSDFIKQLDEKIGRLDGKIDSSVTRLEEKIDSSVTRLDGKIDSSVTRLEEKIDSSVTRLEEIAKTNTLDILHIREDIGGIRETMATKDDVNRIMNFMDKFAADYSSYQNRDIIRGNEIIEHGDKLNDHEARLQKLETK